MSKELGCVVFSDSSDLNAAAADLYPILEHAHVTATHSDPVASSLSLSREISLGANQCYSAACRVILRV